MYVLTTSLLRAPSFSDHASSDFLVRCFACVKRRSECHYSHLADLIESLTQSLVREISSSDLGLGSHIVPWASIRQKGSQNRVVILRQILAMSTSVALGFLLCLPIGNQD